MTQIDRLTRLYSAGKLDRREFMQGAVAAGLTIAGATSIGASAAAAAPKRGGTVRVGLVGASTTASHDPATYTDIFTELGMTGGVHNNLAEIDANGNAVPELAESFESSLDAKTWTIRIRKGVEFHNAKSLTAEDAVASLNHHLGEESKSPAKPLFSDVESIEAVDDGTMVIKLTSGNADFPYVLADYHLPIMPSRDGKLDWADGIGAGGYVLKQVDWGVRMQLERNPNYWKGDTRSHFDAAELVAISDATARQTALMTGSVDVINRVDPLTVRLLERNPDIEIDNVTGNQHFSIPMDTTVAPFDNVDVRLALKHAIDREGLVQKVLNGFGTPANDHPIGPGQRYFSKDLEQRAFDLDKAKFHLKKAGLDSLNVDLSAAETAFSGAVNTALLYKDSAKAAGININVIREPNDGYWSNVWLKKPWCTSFWGGRPTADWMFTLAYAAGGAWNETHWSNERFMTLLLEARAELDQTRRADMYGEMQAIVRDDGGAVIPMYANYVDAHTKKLAHGKLASNFELDGWKILDRWWFT